MSLTHFPPKNVTSCYSEVKNAAFSSVLFFLHFFILQTNILSPLFSFSFSFFFFYPFFILSPPFPFSFSLSHFLSFFSYPFFILSYSTAIQDNALVLLFSKCWVGMRESIILLLFWSENQKVVAWFSRWFLLLRKTKRLKVFSWI